MALEGSLSNNRDEDGWGGLWSGERLVMSISALALGRRGREFFAVSDGIVVCLYHST